MHRFGSEDDVRCGRIGERNEIDHQPISGQEPRTAVVEQIDGELRSLDYGMRERGIREVRVCGDSDPQDGYRRGEGGGLSRPREAALSIGCGNVLYPPIRGVIAEVIARKPRLVGVVHLLWCRCGGGEARRLGGRSSVVEDRARAGVARR